MTKKIKDTRSAEVIAKDAALTEHLKGQLCMFGFAPQTVKVFNGEVSYE